MLAYCKVTNCSSYPTPANTYKLISGKHCLKISIHCSTFPWQKGTLFKSSSPQRLVTNPLVLSFLCLWLYTCYSAFLLHWIYQWPGAAVRIRPLSLLPLNSCSQPSCLTQKIAGSARPALFKVTSTSTSLGTSGGNTAKLRKSDIQCQNSPCLPIPTSLQTLAAVRPERKNLIAEKLSVLKEAETTYIWDASLRLMVVRTGFEGALLGFGKDIFFLHISLAFSRTGFLMNCC